MNNESLSPDLAQSYGRRGLFRIGGLTVATAVVVAACSKSEAGTVGRIGEGGTTPELEEPIVDDGVLMRTMAGIEISIANAYTRILDGGFLSQRSDTLPDLGDQAGLVTTFRDQHLDAAASFNAMGIVAGALPWTCGNRRLDEAYLTPIFLRIEQGVAGTDSAKKIEASDDPPRDYINLVHTLESLSSESCQALVPVVTDPAIRFTAMQWGVRTARQAALVALKIYPGGYVAVAEAVVSSEPETTVSEVDTSIATTIATTVAAGGAAPPPTAIPLPLAIPGQYGLLSPIVYVGGAGDENGVRLKLNFETPSLNSYAYPFDSCV